MKLVSCCVFLLFFSFSTYGQSIRPIEATDAFIKVWGLLKYHHPTVCAGSLDWDSVFVAQLPYFERTATHAQFNQRLTDWISSLGSLSDRPFVSTDYDKSINFNQPHDWIASTSVFSPSTLTLLNDVVRRRHIGPSYYVKTESPGIAVVQHEPLYTDMVCPAESYRLLALARYWNVVAYFFPYRYLTDQPWNEVLQAMIPVFQQANDAAAYLRTVRTLTAKVNDSHSRIVSNPHRIKFLEEANYFLPIQTTVIDSKLVVTGFMNPNAAHSPGLQRGDAILNINQKSVNSQIAQYTPFFGASNQAVVHRDIGEFLIWQPKDTAVVTFQRGNALQTQTIRLSAATTYREPNKTGSDKPVYSILKDRIGYIHIGALAASKTKKTLNKLRKTQGLIIDLREKPQSLDVYRKICNHLSRESTPFVKFLYPTLGYPGTFRSELGYCGLNRKKPSYSGKIVLLVNEYTQSIGEFFTMAFQTLPHATVIGSQTAGADGNVTAIPLPGGYQVLMTGAGIYYPDGRPTQRIGIKADIACSPSIEGIREGRDEILERAVDYIRQNK